MPDQAAFYQACRNAGFVHSPDQNSPDSTGVGPTPFNNPGGVRISTALGYLSQARHRLNLTVRANTHAHRVLIDGKRATGVRAESGGEVFDVHAEEVILSGGAIGSPQLLMLSGIGPAEHLESLGIEVIEDLAGVGQNLRDHPQVPVTFRKKADFNMDPLAPKIQLALRYTAEGSSLRNDMFIHPLSFTTQEGLYLSSDSEPIGISMIVALYLAQGAGEIRLQSTDPREQPLLDYNFLTEPFDRERIREGVRICAQLGRDGVYDGIIDARIDPTDGDIDSDDALDRWMMRRIRTSHHVSGTCKMGPASDRRAVVDNDGRLHGVEGLRVADASIMPDCIRANTNVTSMLIGERIANFLRDRT